MTATRRSVLPVQCLLFLRGAFHCVTLGLLCLVAWGSVSTLVAASIIRDAEIEATLRDLTYPIFRAANLDAESVRVFIVNDERLNAFVAGGQNLFLHTGLIIRTSSPEQLAGVIAHETGHIAGGHLSRTSQALENATTSSLLGALLGAAAAVAGAPQLGTAIMAGGATFAERGFLKYSRGQEQAADQAALDIMTQLGWSPVGLLEFFEVLESQNLRITAEGDEYRRTHPLTRNRIADLAAQIEASGTQFGPMDESYVVAHKKMVTKLEAFLGDPNRIIAKFAGDSPIDRYARSIALFRNAEPDEAVALLRELMEEQGPNPFMYELIGQIRFETGSISKAVPAYRAAFELAPDQALIRLGLGRALIEAQEYDQAAEILQAASSIEPQNATIWRFLGIAEGRRGNEGEASVALAESAVLTRDTEDARLYLARAKHLLDPSHPSWIRIQDLERELNG